MACSRMQGGSRGSAPLPAAEGRAPSERQLPDLAGAVSLSPAPQARARSGCSSSARSLPRRAGTQPARPRCSGFCRSCWRAPPRSGEPWLTAALPMVESCCSCKLMRSWPAQQRPRDLALDHGRTGARPPLGEQPPHQLTAAAAFSTGIADVSHAAPTAAPTTGVPRAPCLHARQHQVAMRGPQHSVLIPVV